MCLLYVVNHVVNYVANHKINYMVNHMVDYVVNHVADFVVDYVVIHSDKLTQLLLRPRGRGLKTSNILKTQLCPYPCRIEWVK